MTNDELRQQLDELKIYRAEKIKIAEARVSNARRDLKDAEISLQWYNSSSPNELQSARRESAEREAYYVKKDAEDKAEAKMRKEDRIRSEIGTRQNWILIPTFLTICWWSVVALQSSSFNNFCFRIGQSLVEFVLGGLLLLALSLAGWLVHRFFAK